MEIVHVRMCRPLLRALTAITVCCGIGAATAQAQIRGRADIAVTFAAIDAAHAGNAGNFFLYGGSIEAHASLFRGLGVVANVTGAHKGSNSAALVPLDLVTVTFGPRYTWPPKVIGSRVSLYGEGLISEANGFHGVFATGSGPVNAINGTTDSANSFALQAGGGVDVRVSRRISIRAVEAEYLRTQLPNGSDNMQSNLRLASGMVFTF